MHTDIRAEVYADLVDRIKEADPDLIIVELLSRDRVNQFAYLMGYGDPYEFNPFNDDDLVDITEVFGVELKKFKQVAWVQDSSGASTVLSLSWRTMYMSPDAFLRPTRQAAGFMSIDAEDTFGKIREFQMVHTKAVAELGDRSYALVRAFVDPDIACSGSWKGKKVEWEESTNGDYVIDSGVNQMPELTATQATEVAISEGIVENIKDVLLAQDIREYHLVGEDITTDIRKGIENWRKNFDKANEYWADAEQYARWGQNDGFDRLKSNLLREKQALQSLLSILKKNPPVEIRMGRTPGISIQSVEKRIKGIDDRLEAIRNGTDGGRGGGGGAGGGGRGGGGGGGRPR